MLYKTSAVSLRILFRVPREMARVLSGCRGSWAAPHGLRYASVHTYSDALVLEREYFLVQCFLTTVKGKYCFTYAVLQASAPDCVAKVAMSQQFCACIQLFIPTAEVYQQWSRSFRDAILHRPAYGICTQGLSAPFAGQSRDKHSLGPW